MRCYGFPPSTRGCTGLSRLDAAGVVFRMSEFEGREAAEDEARNKRCSVELGGTTAWTPGVELAVNEVSDAVRLLVDPKYKHLVCLEELVALQPNLHHEAARISFLLGLLC